MNVSVSVSVREGEDVSESEGQCEGEGEELSQAVSPFLFPLAALPQRFRWSQPSAHPCARLQGQLVRGLQLAPSSVFDLPTDVRSLLTLKGVRSNDDLCNFGKQETDPHPQVSTSNAEELSGLYMARAMLLRSGGEQELVGAASVSLVKKNRSRRFSSAREEGFYGVTILLFAVRALALTLALAHILRSLFKLSISHPHSSVILAVILPSGSPSHDLHRRCARTSSDKASARRCLTSCRIGQSSKRKSAGQRQRIRRATSSYCPQRSVTPRRIGGCAVLRIASSMASVLMQCVLALAISHAYALAAYALATSHAVASSHTSPSPRSPLSLSSAPSPRASLFSPVWPPLSPPTNDSTRCRVITTASSRCWDSRLLVSGRPSTCVKAQCLAVSSCSASRSRSCESKEAVNTGSCCATHRRGSSACMNSARGRAGHPMTEIHALRTYMCILCRWTDP